MSLRIVTGLPSRGGIFEIEILIHIGIEIDLPSRPAASPPSM